MATFNGIPMFGTAVKMLTYRLPRETQVSGYFAVNGCERMDGGFRGRETHVSGVLSGATPLDFATAQGLFETAHDGREYELIDTIGRVWYGCRLESFTPFGKIRRSPAGIMFQEYQAVFSHSGELPMAPLPGSWL